MAEVKSLRKFKTRVYTARGEYLAQITYNGYQWQSINLRTIQDLRVLWQDIGLYIGEAEYSYLDHIEDDKLANIKAAVEAEIERRKYE